MRVSLVPNLRRPGVGRIPEPDGRRASLPEHARLCPVVEDANRMGFLVFPPLEQREALQIRYRVENLYQFTLLRDPGGGQQPKVLFAAEVRPAAGAGGAEVRDIRYVDRESGLDEAAALELIDALITNLDAPAGGVGIRGAFDFVTPEGWDTVYFGVLNEPARPHIPVLTARIETDWYPQNTEFRYSMQPGDVLVASGGAPVGQVMFVRRESVELTPATEAEVHSFVARQEQFWTERSAKERTTPYGALISHHYRDQQRARRAREA
ncbi:MAG: hypothetical protein EPO16_06565 [Dehalococcoidia bacterium]|nr:MAG: hypothetical protein EPO16_06565 [Dehalococcoidia bacterium]